MMLVLGKGKLKPQHGVVAILDALGASNYSEREIRAFLEARNSIKELISDKGNELQVVCPTLEVKVYTFGDTLLVLLKAESSSEDGSLLRATNLLLRQLLVDSLERGIVFRGAYALGAFYEDSGSNTILGKAVFDAAAWFDKADWMGVIATPRTSVHIDHALLEKPPIFPGLGSRRYLVPMKRVDGTGTNESLHSVDWPTAYRMSSQARAHFLGHLKELDVPKGAESKIANTIKFYEDVAAGWPKRTRAKVPAGSNRIASTITRMKATRK